MNVLKDNMTNNLQWKFRRMRLGVTQTEMSSYLGYEKPSIISMYEANKKHSMSQENIQRYQDYIINKEKEMGFYDEG